jgi:hypothetical protein
MRESLRESGKKSVWIPAFAGMTAEFIFRAMAEELKAGGRIRSSIELPTSSRRMPGSSNHLKTGNWIPPAKAKGPN